MTNLKYFRGSPEVADRYEVGDVIEINGLPGKWQRIEARYLYGLDMSKCPNCGGLGWVWHGWFECDQSKECGCVALVDTGEAFVKLAAPTPNH